MSELITAPGEIVQDVMKSDRGMPLHMAFMALQAFSAAHGGFLPESSNVSHAADIYARCVAMNDAAGHPVGPSLEGYEKLIKQLSYCCRGVISPMCALLGGIVGQEVLKAACHKFMPIKQWFYYDASEALSDSVLPLEEVIPMNCRYDSQISVFGRSVQQQLGQLNAFMVGAGAIGCEMLKNWAMMGVSCGMPGSASVGGTTHVTDMDFIEKSNLSRQFLFRNENINQSKSITAVNAARVMNPAFTTVAYEQKAGSETEHIFNDDFWDGLNIVCTALDNVQARLYVDERCVFYHKPLLESGTLGTKGHTQVVVPDLTENYGASRDPPEKTFAICTVKHFPNLIEHTLQWSREWYEEVFKQTPEDCNIYIGSTPESFQHALASQQNMKKDLLLRVTAALCPESRPKCIQDCVISARHAFETQFGNKIKQLLHSFPLNRVSENGVPFWSGAKKPPTPIEFDLRDPLHYEFIVSVSSLLGEVYSIGEKVRSEDGSSHFQLSQMTDPDAIAELLSKVRIERFSPSESVKIPTTEEEAKALKEQPVESDDVDVQCSELIRSLPVTASLSRLVPIEFDKDQDRTMRVVAAAGNLRARAYNIVEADLHRARGIAGKITPAIATTTAFVTGLICMELFKIVQKKKLEQMSNTFNNLAIPFFCGQEPVPPAVKKVVVVGKELAWSLWSRIDITDPNMTLNGLCAHLLKTFGVKLTMLSSGVSILYSEYMNKARMMERQTMTIKQIVESVTKKTIPDAQKFLILEYITADPETDEEVSLPYMRFRLH